MKKMEYYTDVSLCWFAAGYDHVIDIEPFPDQTFLCPSNDGLMRLFLQDFDDQVHFYDSNMLSKSAKWITCDHTFKVSVNIGVKRNGNGKWDTQFDALFVILNELGEVVSWQLTDSTGFSNIENMLLKFKERMSSQRKNLEFIVIDN